MSIDKAQRKSSLELLRIISMVLIIAHHYFVHGNYAVATYETISVGYVFLQICSMFGRPACTVFVLITGFFMVDSPCNKHYRKLVLLVSQMLFYASLAALIVYLVDPSILPGGNLLSVIINLAKSNWFLFYYCLFYPFIPFVNKWARAMSEADYRKFLIVLILIWSVIPTFFGGIWSFGSYIFFFVSYFIGAYIKLHVYGKVNYKNAINLYVAIGAIGFIALSVITCNVLGYIFKANHILENARYFQEYSTIPSLIFSIFIFLYFVNKDFQNKLINRIAATTMGIYILHDTYVLRVILWERVLPNADYISFPYLHFILKVAAVFVVCCVIDFVRGELIGKPCRRWFLKNCDIWINGVKSRFSSKRS